MTHSVSVASLSLVVVTALSAVACGGSAPPPKTEEAPLEEGPRKTGGGGGPSIEQELGSIDQRAVEVTFDRLLQGKLEGCHKQGRGRVDYLSGELKVFLRIGKDGKVRYAFFDESTIGDRETERCVLDVFAAADWPKPQGGEAEVRNGFQWGPGDERQPSPWGPDKVTSALDDDKEVKGAVEKCKGGLSGSFRVTAYVEPGEPERHGAGDDGPKANGSAKGGAKKAEKKGHPGKGGGEHGGRFKAIGIAPPGKDGADKVDCIVDALKSLPLPSPGSYAAKVTFTL